MPGRRERLSAEARLGDRAADAAGEHSAEARTRSADGRSRSADGRRTAPASRSGERTASSPSGEERVRDGGGVWPEAQPCAASAASAAGVPPALASTWHGGFKFASESGSPPLLSADSADPSISHSASKLRRGLSTAGEMASGLMTPTPTKIRRGASQLSSQERSHGGTEWSRSQPRYVKTDGGESPGHDFRA